MSFASKTIVPVINQRVIWSMQQLYLCPSKDHKSLGTVKTSTLSVLLFPVLHDVRYNEVFLMLVPYEEIEAFFSDWICRQWQKKITQLLVEHNQLRHWFVIRCSICVWGSLSIWRVFCSRFFAENVGNGSDEYYLRKRTDIKLALCCWKVS